MAGDSWTQWGCGDSPDHHQRVGALAIPCPCGGQLPRTPGTLLACSHTCYPVSLLAVAPPDNEVSLLGDERCAHLSHEVPEGLCVLSIR